MIRTALLITTFFLFYISTSLYAQQAEVLNKVDGYYEGAVIHDNSVALMTLEFKRTNDSLFAISNVKEWCYYPDFLSLVSEDSFRLKFKTYYGTAILYYDTLYSELIGRTFLPNDTFNIHFKKIRKPVEPGLISEDFFVETADLNLAAKIFIPEKIKVPMACAIFVHGRGCATMQGYQSRAETLSKYGIATVIFDKRGSEPIGFDCDENNIELNTEDLLKVIHRVSRFKEIDEKKIGLIGYSFGGWLAPKAAAKSEIDIAFMVTVVGPATSIKEQQLDNIGYYIREEIGDRPDLIKKVREYTLLEYDQSNDQLTFEKMMKMLENAEEEGWKDVLTESDIPKSADEMGKLWVRRNKYDPREDLKSFEAPFLSLLGENDRVVPLKENSERFVEIFGDAGKENYRIRVIPSAPHWFEHGDIQRNIRTYSGEQVTYLKFDRVVPGAMNEIIYFLRDYDFID